MLRSRRIVTNCKTCASKVFLLTVLTLLTYLIVYCVKTNNCFSAYIGYYAKRRRKTFQNVCFIGDNWARLER